jgi:hypothetical protein
VKLLDHIKMAYFNIMRNGQTVFQSDGNISHSQQEYTDSNSSISSPTLAVFHLCNDSHPPVHDVLCNCGLELYFPTDQRH